MRAILGAVLLAIIAECGPQLPHQEPTYTPPPPVIYYISATKAGSDCFLILYTRYGVVATKEIDCADPRH